MVWRDFVSQMRKFYFDGENLFQYRVYGGYFQPGKTVSGLIVGRTDKPIAHNNVTHVGL